MSGFNSLPIIPSSSSSSLAIDGTLIYQVVNPLNTDDVNDTIQAGITAVKNAGGIVVNVQHSMTVEPNESTPGEYYRVYNGIISYSNSTQNNNTTPMLKFITVALQTNYTNSSLSVGTVGVVLYGQSILAPNQYNVIGSTIIINPGIDVEAGLELVILFQPS